MFKIFLLFCALFALTGYVIFIWIWKKNNQNFYPNNRPFIFGHRGSPTYITENTLTSFEKAIEQGVDGLEFDIRLSKDNKIVIFHDKNLKRLAGANQKIKDLTYSRLQEYRLEHNAKIPLLDDIVPLINQVKALNIEIKSDGIMKGHDILKPLICFLDKHQIDDKCIISSFNPLILLRLKTKRPQTIIGYLYNRSMWLHSWNNLVWMARVRPDNLHIHYSLLDSWIVKWARSKGMRINSYTINEKEIFDKAKQQKIDGVFTDNTKYLK